MKGISLTTVALAFAAVSFLIAGISIILPPKKVPINVTNVTQAVVPRTSTPRTTTTMQIFTTTTEVTTSTIPTLTQEATTTEMVETTITEETVKENCCNEIDDDGDGLENGADPDCQEDVELKEGKNSICWATEILNYGNDRDYYSGWFECPEGYVVEYVTVSFLYKNEEEIYLPLERGDCLISYNANGEVRRKVCGYEEEQAGMNCTRGYIDYKTEEVSPVYICIQETENEKTSKVRLRFKSDSERTATGVMVEEIYCAKKTEKRTSHIRLSIEPNGTIQENTTVRIVATLDVPDQTFFLERNGDLTATGINEINIEETLMVGTYNYTAYWPGNENYTGDSETVIINVVPKEVCKGNVSLTLSAYEVEPDSEVEAKVSSLIECSGIFVSIKKERCDGEELCRCEIIGDSCSCKFKAPSEPNEYTIIACVDMNRDGKFDEEEKDEKVIKVVGEYQPTCNPNGTDENNVCRYDCGADLECEGKEAGSNWCEGNLQKTCDLNCKYEELDCWPYVCNEEEGKCKLECSSDEDCFEGVCDLTEHKCKICSDGKEVGGDSPNNKCEYACGADLECDELVANTQLETCSFGSPNRRDECNNYCKVEDGICDSSCEDYGGSLECSGRLPGNWCEEDLKVSCDDDCDYSFVNCSELGYKCEDGECRESVGGGCPILKAWNGEEFKEIEKLNIHSEEGIDTTYSTSFKMKPFEKNVYKIILEEKWYLLWEGSHVDEVSLKDSEGKECKLIKAIHSRLGDVTSLIEKSDDERVEIKPGENIELIYGDCRGNDFKLEIEGYNPWKTPVKLALSYGNVTLIILTLSILALLLFSFKFFR